MFFEFTLLALTTLVSYVLLSLYKMRRIFEFAKLNNGPKFYPVIGNSYIFSGKDLLQALIYLKDKYSLPCNVWLKHEYIYITDNPREIKTLLNHPKCFDKASFYDDKVKVMLHNTFAMFSSKEREKWKHLRKFSAKSLVPSLFSYFTIIFNKKSDKLVKRLEDIKDYHQLLSVLTNLAFESFVENIIGIEIDSETPNAGFESYLNELQQLLANRKPFGKIVPHWFWKSFTQEGRRFTYLYEKIRDIIYKIIQKKRKRRVENAEFVENPNELLLMDSLLNGEGVKFNDSEIFDQIFLFAIASTDSSSITLSYALIMLGMYPEIQEKLYKEVTENITEDRDVLYKDLNNLKYTEQVILETMRLYSVLPFVGRRTTGDIDIGNKIIPNGCNVLISAYLIHRNENYWPEPENFDPERFAPKDVANIEPGSYIPFLIGPRDCLGKHHAMSLMKVVLAKAIKRFQVVSKPRSTKDFEFRAYMSMKPSAHIKCQFIPRNV